MSGYLANLVARAFQRESTLQPRLASRFEPSEPVGRDFTSFAEPEFGEDEHAYQAREAVIPDPGRTQSAPHSPPIIRSNPKDVAPAADTYQAVTPLQSRAGSGQHVIRSQPPRPLVETIRSGPEGIRSDQEIAPSAIKDAVSQDVAGSQKPLPSVIEIQSSPGNARLENIADREKSPLTSHANVSFQAKRDKPSWIETQAGKEGGNDVSMHTHSKNPASEIIRRTSRSDSEATHPKLEIPLTHLRADEQVRASKISASTTRAAFPLSGAQAEPVQHPTRTLQAPPTSGDTEGNVDVGLASPAVGMSAVNMTRQGVPPRNVQYPTDKPIAETRILPSARTAARVVGDSKHSGDVDVHELPQKALQNSIANRHEIEMDKNYSERPAGEKATGILTPPKQGAHQAPRGYPHQQFESQVETTIEVTIGRVEVRAGPTVDRKQRQAPSAVLPSLEDYLRRRSGRTRDE